MIEVLNITKKYGAHTAVENLSFTVEKGAIYGLLGPNGAGKSTTMNIITGYICATEGTVKINGVDIYDTDENTRAFIGYMPEHPPLYLDMTPREYLHFIAELKDFEKEQHKEIVQRAMSKTGVEDVQNRLIRNLSKGYKQRVGLAGALLGEPEVLILDEPTVGLDPKQIIEIRELIKALAKKHTVLLSSHILPEISAVCDKIIIMNKGKLVAFDTAENLAQPQKGKSVLTIEVQAESESEIDKALSNIDGVQSIETAQNTQDGTFTVSVNCNSGCDIRAQVSLALGKAGLPVLSMKSHQNTLEDIFLLLTEDGEAAENSSTSGKEKSNDGDVLSDDAANEKAKEKDV